MLRVEQVTKRYGDLVAVNAVSFDAGAGEVVAVLGENGAGKTTLLSCIAGFTEYDTGHVSVDGDMVPIGEPGAAIDRGIGTAFQHFSMVPTFTVRESFSLAGLPEDMWLPHLPSRVEASARIADLGVAQRQQLEFLKAQLVGRNVLLLDEPTSPLGDVDVERVLRNITSAAEAGATVLFVTHRLREALAVADRIIVMRHGFMVGSWVRPPDGWEPGTASDLVAAMFGAAQPADQAPQRSSEATPPGGVIAITDLSDRTRYEVGQGRVLAIAGVAGNGQQRITRVLAGDLPVRVEVIDADGAGELHDGSWLRQNAIVIPEDRIGEGVAPEMQLGETIVLRDLAEGRTQTWGCVSRKSRVVRAREMIATWRITPDDPSNRVGNLSGGNIQRVVLAQALDPAPALVVAVNPTQGLDLATAEAVRERLREATRGGSAVVSLEQDPDDALRYADEIAVVFHGELSSPVEAAAAERQQLQLMMVAGW